VFAKKSSLTLADELKAGGEAPPAERPPAIASINIFSPSISRISFRPRRRPEPEPASPPRPEKTFTTMMDYLVGTDDLAKIASISGVMYYSPGFILTVLGLQKFFMKYAEEEGGEYVINPANIVNSKDSEELEAFLNVVSLYDLYLWVLRTSPSMARMVFNLQRSFQPPSVSSQIVEEYGRGRRAGIGAVIGGEEQVKKLAREFRRAPPEEEEAVAAEGEAYG